MKNVLKVCGWIAVVGWLAGCGSLLPQKRTENASVTTAEKLGNRQTTSFERVLETGVKVPREFWVRAAGTNVPDRAVTSAATTVAGAPWVREITKLDSTSEQDAGSTEVASARLKVSLPLGVTIGLLAVALLILLYAIKAWRKESRTADAAFEVADRIGVKGINRLQTLAASVADAGVKAEAHRAIAELEAERGKAAGQARPKGAR